MTFRGVGRRLFALVSSLWLTIAMVEPVGLHACPMHDTLHGAHHGVVAPATTAHASGGHDAAHHDQHAAPTAGAPADAEPDAARGGPPVSDAPGASVCSCLGSCCAATGVAMPDGPPPTIVASETDGGMTAWPGSPVAVATGGLRLPFATGPPAAL